VAKPTTKVAKAKAKAKAKKPTGRPASVSLHAGAKFGDLTIIRKAHLKEGLRIFVKCVCGKEFYTKTQYLTRKPNPQTHCGCKLKVPPNPYAYEKICWQSMHLRCCYEKHVSYMAYGGRGIKICDRWHRDNPQGFANYLEDMGKAPTRQHTMDRINVDGNYEPSNCQWATKTEQARNQRRFSGKTWEHKLKQQQAKAKETK